MHHQDPRWRRGRRGPHQSTDANKARNGPRSPEGYGIPQGRVLTGANRHHSPLPAPTLDPLDDLGPLPQHITVHLHPGYNSGKTRDKTGHTKPARRDRPHRRQSADPSRATLAWRRTMWACTKIAKVVPGSIGMEGGRGGSTEYLQRKHTNGKKVV